MAETIQRTDGARQALDLLHRMNRSHRRLLDRRFASLGIHGGQHRLLLELSCRGPAMAQTELARCMDVTPASVAAMLKRLETGGYIERKASSEDERCNQVALTEKGRGIVETSVAVFDEVDNSMLSGFGEDEIAQLQAYIARINDNLHAMEDALDAQTAKSNRKDVDRS